MEHIYDMIVVGGGPGGYTAALYGVRAGLDTLVVEKMSAGGQMTLTTQIDNYPGFENGVDGNELGEKMRLGAERFGAKTEYAEVLSLELEGEIKKVVTSTGELLSRTVILATGASPRRLGIPGEAEFTGLGVSYCAACDGMLYRGRTVVVAGGGNTAAHDAITLSRICEKVIVIHRRDTLRASRVYHEPLAAAKNIEFRWNSAITEIHGDDIVSGVTIKDLKTGETGELECGGVFVCIGREPASALVRGKLECDETGYVIADETTRTAIPGVYAIGDLRTKPLRQVVTAAADGATAAHFAEQYLTEAAGR